MNTSLDRFQPPRVGWIDLLNVALLTICLLLIGLALRPVILWGVSVSWQPVTATLVEVRVTDLHTPEQKKTQRKSLYQRDVIFRYEADGQVWTSTQWGWDLLARSTNNLESATHIFERFHSRAGKTITAWVNPHNPAQAVLVREPFWVGLLFQLGGACVAFLLYLVVELLRSQPTEAARFARLVDAALLAVRLVVILFTFALALDNHLGRNPHWGLTAACAGFAGLWIWGVRQLQKQRRSGAPIMSWERWEARLPAFVNPKTRLNEFAPPVTGQVTDCRVVPWATVLLAALLALGSYAAYTALWPQDTDAQPTRLAGEGEYRCRFYCPAGNA